MRILILNWQDRTNPYSGGAETHLHEIFSRIAARGAEVRLLCSSYAGCAPEDMVDGLRVIRRGHRSTFNLELPFVYRRELAHLRFDVVIDDLNKIPFYAPLFVRAPVLAVVPHLFGTTAFREVAAPLAAYVWGSELLLSRVYRGCPFLVISDSTRQDLISRGIPAGKITVSHCGIDHGTYVPAHGTEPADPPLIVHLGRMKRYKNVDHVLKAMPLIWEREPRARLVLAGAGEYLPRLKEISRRLGLDDRVEFAGYLTLPRIVALLQRATVVLNTSSKEGWGLTVVEANACGCPVVAYDVPGLRDSVADGETGFLVPFRDIPALADRAKALLSDRALRERLGKAAREWAVKFSWDTAADEMLDMIRLAAENSAERS